MSPAIPLGEERKEKVIMRIKDVGNEEGKGGDDKNVENDREIGI